MARLSSLLFIVLAVIVLISVSANDYIYIASDELCTAGLTCPVGNPSFHRTFALNGTLSPNLTLNVGDRLEFDLLTNISQHLLTICENSPSPSFCQGVSSSDELATPINTAGANISVTFNTAGTYYYGCHIHPGMGAIITVVEPDIEGD